MCSMMSGPVGGVGGQRGDDSRGPCQHYLPNHQILTSSSSRRRRGTRAGTVAKSQHHSSIQDADHQTWPKPKHVTLPIQSLQMVPTQTRSPTRASPQLPISFAPAFQAVCSNRRAKKAFDCEQQPSPATNQNHQSQHQLQQHPQPQHQPQQHQPQQHQQQQPQQQPQQHARSQAGGLPSSPQSLAPQHDVQLGLPSRIEIRSNCPCCGRVGEGGAVFDASVRSAGNASADIGGVSLPIDQPCILRKPTPPPIGPPPGLEMVVPEQPPSQTLQGFPQEFLSTTAPVNAMPRRVDTCRLSTAPAKHEADAVSATKSSNASVPHQQTGSKDSWPRGTTSVMLRNIPNRYTPEELLQDMVNKGFEGAFDFFYLPTDFCTKKNKGYGFVNLRSADLALQFRLAFDGQRLTRYVTQKVLEMSPAVTQGFEANVSKYLKHQAGRVQNPWFKPMIFVPSDEVGGAPWRCLPLTEESLPEYIRTSPGSNPQCRSQQAAPSQPRHRIESCTTFDGGDMPGFEDDEDASMQAAVSGWMEAHQEAVQKFLRQCAVSNGSSSTSADSSPRGSDGAPLQKGISGNRRTKGRLRVAPVVKSTASSDIL